jgi:hypothetical protein
MGLSFDNLSKPSNKNYKKWADLALYLLPVYLSALIATPLNDTVKLWATFIVTVITVTIKGLTKFTTDEELS